MKKYQKRIEDIIFIIIIIESVLGGKNEKDNRINEKI